MEKRFDAPRAVLAGLAGAAAYLAEQYLDLRLLRFPGDDLKLLGMVATRRDPAWRMAGVAMHAANGVALGFVYAALARDRLPGAAAVRGLLLAQIENAVLWPAVPLIIDRYHPGIREGRLPRLATPAYATQSVLRHAAYGAVLGAFYG